MPEPLSERELDVLKLVSAGLSNREIGNKLGLSEGTVKNCITSVLQKIGVRDRAQARMIQDKCYNFGQSWPNTITT